MFVFDFKRDTLHYGAYTGECILGSSFAYMIRILKRCFVNLL